jgi:hypothetical protein
MRAGWITGAVAASATAGALVGFARVEHASPFGDTGRQLFATLNPAATPSPTMAALAGLCLHVIIALAWGMLFARLASGLRAGRLLAVALLVSAGVWALNVRVVPSLLRFGNDYTAFARQAVVFYIVLSLAFAAGIRLARTQSE